LYAPYGFLKSAILFCSVTNIAVLLIFNKHKSNLNVTIIMLQIQILL
jgi:hypothetical protein